MTSLNKLFIFGDQSWIPTGGQWRSRKDYEDPGPQLPHHEDSKVALETRSCLGEREERVRLDRT